MPGSNQRGAALLLILLLIVVGGGIAFVGQLRSAGVDLEAQHKTAAALAEAKQALLGRAASNDDPGSLPCPDADGDGESKVPEDYSGGNCVALVGRLPWKTLRLSDLRDGGGERLWYVLDPGFRDHGVAILPALAGSINVVGVAPMGNVAAVVIAPGGALSGQNRSAAQLNDRAQYLESYVDPTTVTAAAPGPAYNDRLMVISAAEIHRPSTQRMARELILANLPHPYPAGTLWFPTTGNWAPPHHPMPAGRWFAWLGATNYVLIDADTAKLGFAGCTGGWAIRWDGAQTTMTGSC